MSEAIENDVQPIDIVEEYMATLYDLIESSIRFEIMTLNVSKDQLHNFGTIKAVLENYRQLEPENQPVSFQDLVGATRQMITMFTELVQTLVDDHGGVEIENILTYHKMLSGWFDNYRNNY